MHAADPGRLHPGPQIKQPHPHAAGNGVIGWWVEPVGAAMLTVSLGQRM